MVYRVRLLTAKEMSVVDTWQKESGKWKVLVTANVSRHPIPPEQY